jgi:hypothetical protein
VHLDYPVLRALRGFLVSYSLPSVSIALSTAPPSIPSIAARQISLPGRHLVEPR